MRRTVAATARAPPVSTSAPPPTQRPRSEALSPPVTARPSSEADPAPEPVVLIEAELAPPADVSEKASKLYVPLALLGNVIGTEMEPVPLAVVPPVEVTANLIIPTRAEVLPVTRTETKMGLAAVLNDLHKGRDAGKAWGVVIDISAVFMTLVSMTGLVMICFMQKKRFSGLLAGAVGAALCLAVYWIWVP